MSALGTGTDIYSPHGTLVLDIGAGVTNVGIIALGDIVYTKAFYLAGNSFTKAIIKHLRKIIILSSEKKLPNILR